MPFLIGSEQASSGPGCEFPKFLAYAFQQAHEWGCYND